MFKTARDLREHVLDAVGHPVGGLAASIPIPVGARDIKVAVFFYLEKIYPNARVILPPHYRFLLNPTTGEVLTHRAIAPSEIGPDAPAGKPLPRHPDERRPSDVDMIKYFDDKDRLYEIFHEAWWAFAQNEVRFTPSRRALLVECLEHFDAVAEKRLLPWYEELGAPFWRWLRAVRDRH